MEAKIPRKLLDTICLDICDGFGGRCQRYPELSESCTEFYPLLKAYKAGIREVVEWVENNSSTCAVEKHIRCKEWQTQLEKWGV